MRRAWVRRARVRRARVRRARVRRPWLRQQSEDRVGSSLCRSSFDCKRCARLAASLRARVQREALRALGERRGGERAQLQMVE
eukprot:6764903-Prymnesium_polylepis.1